MDLADAQWATFEPLFRPKRRDDGRGRPWTDARAVLNGVLWVLRTGAPWHDLPRRYPPYQTCHRRFQQWQPHDHLRDRNNCGASAWVRCCSLRAPESYSGIYEMSSRLGSTWAGD